MRHFIKIRLGHTHKVWYLYNDVYNKIGDFDYYGYAVRWYKQRSYRGGFVFSKQPHKEWENDRKEWHYGGKGYKSYEEYIMAVIG